VKSLSAIHPDFGCVSGPVDVQLKVVGSGQMPPSPTDPELPLDPELPDQELPLDPELLPDELAEELLEEPLDDDDPVLPPDEEVPEPASSPSPDVPFELDVPHAAIAAAIPTRSRPPEGSRMMPSQ
jgi:hypothetical protein